jgi:ABC-type Fe3+-hydroxamate transport system substrate-binding protein
MHTLNRKPLLGLLLVMLLSACGSVPAAPASESADESSTALSAQSSIVAKHARGELKLAQPARRVVACSEEAADFLLALDVQPVGFCSARVEGVQAGAQYTLPHFFPKEKLGTPTFLGSSLEPSLEELVKTRPDLILLLDEAEQSYNQASQIAPTMMIDASAKDYWKGTLIEIGKLVGREAQARQFLADFERTSTEQRAKVAPVVQQTPNVMLLYSFAASDGTMVMSENWTGAQLLTQLGFKLVTPPGVTVPEQGFVLVSPEVVSNASTDIILVIRPKGADGSVPRYPIDEILDSLDGVRVVYQEIDPTRGSSAPLTDKFVLEEFARLLSAPAQ